jgi:diaminopimelate epimerase
LLDPRHCASNFPLAGLNASAGVHRLPMSLRHSSVWPFRKMHGLGNDFVVFDARQRALSLSAELVRRLAHRQMGIGCDTVVVLDAPPADSPADVAIRFYNADGTPSDACGNATRCVAALLAEEGRPAPLLQTGAGLLQTQARATGFATVDMGQPRFGWDEIPLAYPMDTLNLPLGWEGLSDPSCVNIGNPHVVFFVDDLDAAPLSVLGPVIETDPVFPNRINVNVAQVLDRQTMRLKVWERGSGLTLACGTGACATTVAAIRRGLVDRSVTVHLPGGPLQITWRADDGVVAMAGSATTAFRGTIDLKDYAVGLAREAAA